MTSFQSILFETPVHDGEPTEPDFFRDLLLDQVRDSMLAGRDEYDLLPVFHTSLGSVEEVRYRHEILRDLEKKPIRDRVQDFAYGMRDMRAQLAQSEKLYYRLQKQRWFLDAAGLYCASVRTVAEDLMGVELTARGLVALKDYLSAYVESDEFVSLVEEVQRIQEDLAAVRYSVHIKGPRVRVDDYGGEPDYSAEVEEAFAKFKQGAVKSHLVDLHDLADMNHVEANVLELVARLNPKTFSALSAFCQRHASYADAVIARFDQEVQFYLAYLEHIEPMKRAGLSFCYPAVSARSKEVCAEEAFDLALATKLVPEQQRVVPNDFRLDGKERILVVSGPNQGGKTTFARAFGQLHYLASLGLPVPGRRARLFLPDRIFTHFEREEDLSTLRGKLEDELVRIHDILGDATTDSLVVMNESFSSTTLQDAVFLGTEVLTRIVDLGALALCVTFVDELSTLGVETVSMVSTVVPENPAERTFKIVRRRADGLAYAAALAEKYDLTYDSLKRRVAA
jgi:hypothetical protein